MNPLVTHVIADYPFHSQYTLAFDVVVRIDLCLGFLLVFILKFNIAGGSDLLHVEEVLHCDVIVADGRALVEELIWVCCNQANGRFNNI